MKYVCDVCGWEYDEEKGAPEHGIAPGTKWEDVPEDFECPLCSVGKDEFSEAQNETIQSLKFLNDKGNVCRVITEIIDRNSSR